MRWVLRWPKLFSGHISHRDEEHDMPGDGFGDSLAGFGSGSGSGGGVGIGALRTGDGFGVGHNGDKRYGNGRGLGIKHLYGRSWTETDGRLE